MRCREQISAQLITFVKNSISDKIYGNSEILVYICQRPALHRQPHDFNNLDFQFPDYGVILDAKCIAIVPLPAYQIARIRTGQYISGADQLWEAKFQLQP